MKERKGFFTQAGHIFINGERRACVFSVSVESGLEDKFLTVYDPASKVQISMPAELVSFWLEHGTQ